MEIQEITTSVFIVPGIIAAIISFIINLLFWIYKYGKHIEKINSIKTDIETYRQKTDNIEKSLARLEGRFDTYEKQSLTRKESPIALTENGKDLLQKSSGKEYLEKNFDALFKEFDNLSSAYDIQEKARSVIRNKKDNKHFNKIKEYLFQEGMNFDDLTLVMGIELRDMVLEKKGIPIKQVDTDDPTK